MLDAFVGLAIDAITANQNANRFVSYETVNHGTRANPFVQVTVTPDVSLPAVDAIVVEMRKAPVYGQLSFCTGDSAETCVHELSQTVSPGGVRYENASSPLAQVRVKYMPIDPTTFELETRDWSEGVVFPRASTAVTCLPNAAGWCEDRFSLEIRLVKRYLIFETVMRTIYHDRVLFMRPQRSRASFVEIATPARPLLSFRELSGILQIRDSYEGRFHSEYVVSADAAEVAPRTSEALNFRGRCSGLLYADGGRVENTSSVSHADALRGTFSQCTFLAPPERVFDVLASLEVRDVFEEHPLTSSRAATGVPRIARVQLDVRDGARFRRAIFKEPMQRPQRTPKVVYAFEMFARDAARAELTEADTLPLPLIGWQTPYWRANDWLVSDYVEASPHAGYLERVDSLQYTPFNHYTFDAKKENADAVCDLATSDQFRLHREMLFFPRDGQHQPTHATARTYDVAVCLIDQPRPPKAMNLTIHDVLPGARVQFQPSVMDSNDFILGSVDMTPSDSSFYQPGSASGFAPGAGILFERTVFPWGVIRGPSCDGPRLQPLAKYPFANFCLDAESYTRRNMAGVYTTFAPFRYRAVDGGGTESAWAYVLPRLALLPIHCSASETSGVGGECTLVGEGRLLAHFPVLETRLEYTDFDFDGSANAAPVEDADDYAQPTRVLRLERLPVNGTLRACETVATSCDENDRELRVGDEIAIEVGDNTLFSYTPREGFYNVYPSKATTVFRRDIDHSLAYMYTDFHGETIDRGCSESTARMYGCPDVVEFSLLSDHLEPVRVRFNVFVASPDGHLLDAEAPVSIDAVDLAYAAVSRVDENSGLCDETSVNFPLLGDVSIPSGWRQVESITFDRVPRHGKLAHCEDRECITKGAVVTRNGAFVDGEIDARNMWMDYSPDLDYANRVVGADGDRTKPLIEDAAGRRTVPCMYYNLNASDPNFHADYFCADYVEFTVTFIYSASQTASEVFRKGLWPFSALFPYQRRKLRIRRYFQVLDLPSPPRVQAISLVNDLYELFSEEPEIVDLDGGVYTFEFELLLDTRIGRFGEAFVASTQHSPVSNLSCSESRCVFRARPDGFFPLFEAAVSGVETYSPADEHIVAQLRFLRTLATITYVDGRTLLVDDARCPGLQKPYAGRFEYFLLALDTDAPPPADYFLVPVPPIVPDVELYATGDRMSFILNVFDADDHSYVLDDMLAPEADVATHAPTIATKIRFRYGEYEVLSHPFGNGTGRPSTFHDPMDRNQMARGAGLVFRNVNTGEGNVEIRLGGCEGAAVEPLRVYRSFELCAAISASHATQPGTTIKYAAVDASGLLGNWANITITSPTVGSCNADDGALPYADSCVFVAEQRDAHDTGNQTHDSIAHLDVYLDENLQSAELRAYLGIPPEATFGATVLQLPTKVDLYHCADGDCAARGSPVAVGDFVHIENGRNALVRYTPRVGLVNIWHGTSGSPPAPRNYSFYSSSGRPLKLGSCTSSRDKGCPDELLLDLGFDLATSSFRPKRTRLAIYAQVPEPPVTCSADEDAEIFDSKCVARGLHRSEIDHVQETNTQVLRALQSGTGALALTPDEIDSLLGTVNRNPLDIPVSVYLHPVNDTDLVEEPVTLRLLSLPVGGVLFHCLDPGQCSSRGEVARINDTDARLPRLHEGLNTVFIYSPYPGHFDHEHVRLSEHAPPMQDSDTQNFPDGRSGISFQDVFGEPIRPVTWDACEASRKQPDDPRGCPDAFSFVAYRMQTASALGHVRVFTPFSETNVARYTSGQDVDVRIPGSRLTCLGVERGSSVPVSTVPNWQRLRSLTVTQRPSRIQVYACPGGECPAAPDVPGATVIENDTVVFPEGIGSNYPLFKLFPEPNFANDGVGALPHCRYKGEGDACAETMELQLAYPAASANAPADPELGSASVRLRFGLRVFVEVAGFMPPMQVTRKLRFGNATSELQDVVFPGGDAHQFSYSVTVPGAAVTMSEGHGFDKDLCRRGPLASCEFEATPSEFQAILRELTFASRTGANESSLHITVLDTDASRNDSCLAARISQDGILPLSATLRVLTQGAHNETWSPLEEFRYSPRPIVPNSQFYKYPFRLDISHTLDFQDGPGGFLDPSGAVKGAAGVRFTQTDFVRGQIRRADCLGSALETGVFFAANTFCFVHSLFAGETALVTQFDARDSAGAMLLGQELEVAPMLLLDVCNATSTSRIGDTCTSTGLASDALLGASHIPIDLGFQVASVVGADIPQDSTVRVDILSLPRAGTLYRCLDPGVCRHLGGAVLPQSSLRVPLSLQGAFLAYVPSQGHASFRRRRAFVESGEENLLLPDDGPVPDYGLPGLGLDETNRTDFLDHWVVPGPGDPDEFWYSLWTSPHEPAISPLVHHVHVQSRHFVTEPAHGSTYPPASLTLRACNASATSGIDHGACTVVGHETAPFLVTVDMAGPWSPGQSLQIAQLPAHGTLYHCLDPGPCRTADLPVGDNPAPVPIPESLLEPGPQALFRYVPNPGYVTFATNEVLPTAIFQHAVSGLPLNQCADEHGRDVSKEHGCPDHFTFALEGPHTTEGLHRVNIYVGGALRNGVPLSASFRESLRRDPNGITSLPRTRARIIQRLVHTTPERTNLCMSGNDWQPFEQHEYHAKTFTEPLLEEMERYPPDAIEFGENDWVQGLRESYRSEFLASNPDATEVPPRSPLEELRAVKSHDSTGQTRYVWKISRVKVAVPPRYGELHDLNSVSLLALRYGDEPRLFSNRLSLRYSSNTGYATHFPDASGSGLTAIRPDDPACDSVSAFGSDSLCNDVFELDVEVSVEVRIMLDCRQNCTRPIELAAKASYVYTTVVDVRVVKQEWVPVATYFSLPPEPGGYARTELSLYDPDRRTLASEFIVDTGGVPARSALQNSAFFPEGCVIGPQSPTCKLVLPPGDTTPMQEILQRELAVDESPSRAVRVMLTYSRKLHPTAGYAYVGTCSDNPKSPPRVSYLSIHPQGNDSSAAWHWAETGTVESDAGSGMRFHYGALAPANRGRGSFALAGSYTQTVRHLPRSELPAHDNTTLLAVTDELVAHIDAFPDESFHIRRRLEYIRWDMASFSTSGPLELGYICQETWYDEQEVFTALSLPFSADEDVDDYEDDYAVDYEDGSVCISPVVHRVRVCTHDVQALPITRDADVPSVEQGTSLRFRVEVYDANDFTYADDSGELSWYAFRAANGDVAANAGIFFFETVFPNGELRAANCRGRALNANQIHPSTEFCFVSNGKLGAAYAFFLAVDGGGGISADVGAAVFDVLPPFETVSCSASEYSGYSAAECTAIGYESNDLYGDNPIPIALQVNEQLLRNNAPAMIRILDLPAHGKLFLCADRAKCDAFDPSTPMRDYNSTRSLLGEPLKQNSLVDVELGATHVYFLYVGNNNYFNFAMQQVLHCRTGVYEYGNWMDEPFPVFVDMYDRPYRECPNSAIDGCPDAFYFETFVADGSQRTHSERSRYNIYVQNIGSRAHWALQERKKHELYIPSESVPTHLRLPIHHKFDYIPAVLTIGAYGTNVHRVSVPRYPRFQVKEENPEAYLPFLVYEDPDGDTWDVEFTIASQNVRFIVAQPGMPAYRSERRSNFGQNDIVVGEFPTPQYETIPIDVNCDDSFDNSTFPGALACTGTTVYRGSPTDIQNVIQNLWYMFIRSEKLPMDASDPRAMLYDNHIKNIEQHVTFSLRKISRNPFIATNWLRNPQPLGIMSYIPAQPRFHPFTYGIFHPNCKVEETVETYLDRITEDSYIQMKQGRTDYQIMESTVIPRLSTEHGLWQEDLDRYTQTYMDQMTFLPQYNGLLDFNAYSMYHIRPEAVVDIVKQLIISISVLVAVEAAMAAALLLGPVAFISAFLVTLGVVVAVEGVSLQTLFHALYLIPFVAQIATAVRSALGLTRAASEVTEATVKGVDAATEIAKLSQAATRPTVTKRSIRVASMGKGVKTLLYAVPKRIGALIGAVARKAKSAKALAKQSVYLRRAALAVREIPIRIRSGIRTASTAVAKRLPSKDMSLLRGLKRAPTVRTPPKPPGRIGRAIGAVRGAMVRARVAGGAVVAGGRAVLRNGAGKGTRLGGAMDNLVQPLRSVAGRLRALRDKTRAWFKRRFGKNKDRANKPRTKVDAVKKSRLSRIRSFITNLIKRILRAIFQGLRMVLRMVYHAIKFILGPRSPFRFIFRMALRLLFSLIQRLVWLIISIAMFTFALFTVTTKKAVHDVLDEAENARAYRKRRAELFFGRSRARVHPGDIDIERR